MDEATLEALRRGAGLAVDVEGCFTMAGRPVEHPRVQRLFHAGLALRADGEVTLTVGPWWCYVAVARTAFFVEALRRREGCAGAWEAVLAGGRAVALEGAVFGYGPDDRIYLWSDGLAGPAILLRPAHMQAAAALAEGDGRGDSVMGCPLIVLKDVPELRTPRPPMTPTRA